jgi:hypothetical protein
MNVVLSFPSYSMLVCKGAPMYKENLLINQQQNGKNSVLTAPQAIKMPKSRPILECKSNNIDRLPSTTGVQH